MMIDDVLSTRELVDFTEQLESSDTANTCGDSKSTKSLLQLAAYGVIKQGDIGGILADGMHLRKKTGDSNNRSSIAEEEHSEGPSPTKQILIRKLLKTMAKR
ncbi:hypothetical protein INT45_013008 [Circinella minor]|uniref:Uncharacterized protein n=1 Tax=Circinella minor TaxID=1195481 RepID=A0A8H7VFU4_9FUNG|nr:hypothetical protein INT45_013008 [Circinella minor]